MARVFFMSHYQDQRPEGPFQQGGVLPQEDETTALLVPLLRYQQAARLVQPITLLDEVAQLEASRETRCRRAAITLL